MPDNYLDARIRIIAKEEITDSWWRAGRPRPPDCCTGEDTRSSITVVLKISNVELF